ncbi:MAG: cell division protein ZapE [Rhodospirillum sp.]|nr:cell division protein ZapE [Rhodospirillum sp.]
MHIDRVAAFAVSDALVSSSLEDGPLSRYRALQSTGALAHDAAQELAAEKLQSLWKALKNYQPSEQAGGWRERLGLARRREAEAPQGLYIFGPVGRGKSMLMDLFFATAPIERKRRVHFHAFMLEVQETLHRWRQDKDGKDDVIAALADKIAGEATLLCFDEFHVSNIADAMILGRLFEALFDRGVVVVATSNWEPDDLYQGGLQRDRFLPFIALIKDKLDILELDAARDYRLQRIKDMRTYFHPLGDLAARHMTDSFARLTGGAAPRADHLIVQERRLDVPRQAVGVAWFDFDELCERPLGAADYLAIATHFNTVLIDCVPTLSPDQRDVARRFVTLIDALYEHRVNVVIAAAAPPERLYPSGDGSFDFGRTVSRLNEMQSVDYLTGPHLT